MKGQPHFAFGTTAEGLLKCADHRRRHGIPFDGPRSHRGMSAASVYFRDVDGHNLEVSTWEDVPEEPTTPIGGPHGFPVWEKLAPNWRPDNCETLTLIERMNLFFDWKNPWRKK